MRMTLLWIPLLASLAAVALAADDPTARRRTAMPPRSAEAQRIRRAQYIHPATAAKRASLYARTGDMLRRSFWWYHSGPNDVDPPPAPETPPESPRPSPNPPKQCKQTKWFTCSPDVKSYNGYTVADYGISGADNDGKCCGDGWVCKDFGAFKNSFCVIDLDYDAILEKFNEALCDTEQKVLDYFNGLLLTDP